MSNYSGQYLAGLNTIPQQGPAQQSSADLGFDDELALFTNSELFDFDVTKVNQDDYSQEHAKASRRKAGKPSNLDFANGANFNMFDPSQPMPQLQTNFPTGNFDPQLFHSPPQSATFQSPNQPIGAASPEDSQQGVGHKRPYSSTTPQSPDDQVRVAAEEDKRRRNTAASARFRVKKKQREAALEQSAKENADRVDQLQKRVNELEMENKWLRDLVVQKEGKQVKGEESSEQSVQVEDTIAGKQLKRGIGTTQTA